MARKGSYFDEKVRIVYLYICSIGMSLKRGGGGGGGGAALIWSPAPDVELSM